MKIATWNIERLEHKNKLHDIIAVCEHENADILVLTEADERVKLPSYPYCYSTMPPLAHDLAPYTIPIRYAPTERRVIIYTKYPCIRHYSTYDKTTAICVEVEAEYSNLLVYGSIIGIHGHRKPFFMNDLYGQMSDLRRLTADGHQVCFLGDYNCSFADNYYPSSVGKTAMLECFAESGIKLLTADRLECIDHISISKDYTNMASISINEWNCDKKLSDHKGIAVVF
ncbi:MAG: endonuclease/exonuclease/phosphatase family protein [Oscillospiraceae bacterium]|nr:endonuclease/exonuclease/phosphatase family protein [Oscillospiraceae bacterium]